MTRRLRSELRVEVQQMLDEIYEEKIDLEARLERLADLRRRGEELLGILGDGTPDYNLMESISAWLSDQADRT
jgi:hypothetical protein